MKFGMVEVLLIMLAAIVLTLVALWAWEEFKLWRINRAYGPGNRRAGVPGRRRND